MAENVILGTKRCISHSDHGWWITASTSAPSAPNRRPTNPRSKPPSPGSELVLPAPLP